MKVTCPKCFNRFMSTGFYIPEGREITFSGNSIFENCPKCGHRFDSFKNINGVYDIKDGEATMIRTLEGIELSNESINKIKSTNFDDLSSVDQLLNVSKNIDDGFFNVISEWIAKGIAIVTIILALNVFSGKVATSTQIAVETNTTSTEQVVEAPVKKLSRVERQAESADMLPASAKKSFINSFNTIKGDSTLKKLRDTESLDVEKLKEIVANKSKKK